MKELIDLTETDEEDGSNDSLTLLSSIELHRPKMPNHTIGNNSGVASSSQKPARQFQRDLSQSAITTTTSSAVNANANAGRAPLQGLYERNPLARADLVNPIVWHERLPKKEYDPSTIARDVLLAASAHPHLGGLNSAFSSLKAFAAVNEDSDLDTFRWDIADGPDLDDLAQIPLETATPHTIPLRAPVPRPLPFSEDANRYHYAPAFMAQESIPKYSNMQASKESQNRPELSMLSGAGNVRTNSLSGTDLQTHPQSRFQEAIAQPGLHDQLVKRMQGTGPAHSSLYSRSAPPPSSSTPGPAGQPPQSYSATPSNLPLLNARPSEFQPLTYSPQHSDFQPSHVQSSNPQQSSSRVALIPTFGRNPTAPILQGATSTQPLTSQESVTSLLRHAGASSENGRRSPIGRQQENPNSIGSAQHNQNKLSHRPNIVQNGSPAYQPPPTRSSNFAIDLLGKSISFASKEPSINPTSYPQSPARGGPPNTGSNHSRIAVQIPSYGSKKRGRPFRNSASSSSSPQNIPPKKKGRPFATRESAAKATEKAALKAAGLPTEKKKHGRPSKHRIQQNIPVPEPIYHPFICEWKDCPAELQNLETLRLHLFNVHGKKRQITRTYHCLWHNCTTKEDASEDELAPSEEKDEYEDVLEFATKMEWCKHVEETHIDQIFREMGDGPKGDSLGRKPTTARERSPWRFDSEGNEIIKSVRGQPIEEGSARENNARRFRQKMSGTYVVPDKPKALETYSKVFIPADDENDDLNEDNREERIGRGMPMQINDSNYDDEETGAEDEDDGDMRMAEF